MAKSTRSRRKGKPAKPYADFPRFPTPRGAGPRKSAANSITLDGGVNQPLPGCGVRAQTETLYKAGPRVCARPYYKQEVQAAQRRRAGGKLFPGEAEFS